MTPTTDLVPLNEARVAIREARVSQDAASLKDWRDLAEAAEKMQQRRGTAREVADDAGEIRLRCEAALGQIDAEVAPSKVRADRRPTSTTTVDVPKPPLAEVHPTTRAAWRKLGKLDDEQLDDLTSRLRESEDAGLDTTNAVKMLKGDALGVHTSSATPEWSTPQDLFDKLHSEFKFTLDVCATPGLEKCKHYYSPEQDGLAQKWTGSCWMNPPYGSEIPAWIQKAAEEAASGATVVCLVPARVDTAWWWDYVSFAEVRFLRGRLKFGGAETSAPFPSAVVVFGRPMKTVYWEWR